MAERRAGGALLEFDRLSAGYTDQPVVTEFSATIAQGSITTIIGPNGAGKSTLLRAVYGLNRHFGGTLRFLGEPIESLAPNERLKRGIGFVPQGRCNFPLMSVRENLELGAYTLPRAAARDALRTGARAISDAEGKARRAGRKPERRRAADPGNRDGARGRAEAPAARRALARPVARQPGPASSRRSRSCADGGLTVLVVEQNAHGALRISDTGIVMELGRLFMSGPAAEVIADPRIRVAYLGGEPG